jgi:aldehyde:ferredoxin oxidoreductase
MPKGYSGKILRVNLSTGTLDIQTYEEEFYRQYLGGGGIGTYFLLNETKSDTDPLSPENVLTIAPGITTGPAVSGVSRCSVTSLSPETGAVGDSQAGGNLGPFLKRTGFDAVVITGKAEKPSYLYLSNEKLEIRDAGEYSGLAILEAKELFVDRLGTSKISVLQCGPAGENQISYANLASDLNNYYGRTGMGAVFGSKNLRAVVVSGVGSIDFEDSENLKKLAKTGAGRIAGAGFVSLLKQLGTPGLLEGNAAQGNLCTHNYSSGFHKDYKKLDGTTIDATIASKGTTCYGCAVGCRKTIKTEHPYNITDKLGGPEFETLGVLGSNLDIFDLEIVGKANELCNNYGLDTITLGGIIAYLFESIEKGVINEKDLGLGPVGFGQGESLIKLVELTIKREGIGDILANGFEACIKYFGEETRDYAVHVKNHGLAVHMTQVKPAMSLIYAVAPIGADHMSCEHDWLGTESGEEARGLGLLKPGELNSTGTDKVRLVVYSQYYYAALDSLGLCMFCWGAGNLFTYSELVELIHSVTGLDMTFWEVMKAGERRITMMRLLNIRRGFSADSDKLPKKLFNGITDGPSEGRRVDKAGFESMKSHYYGFLGWNSEGVPANEKIVELGLEWI